jgi:hypothetical protein
MSSFQDFFVGFKDFNFEISKRGGLEFDKIAKKLEESKSEKFIIDISINGYSSKDTFDFELNEIKWSSFKTKFIKGTQAQNDPAALSVKRAIRILSFSTTEYIKIKKIVPYLNKYNEKCPKEFCHLGGHYVVDEKNASQLILLWKNFDKVKKLTVSNSVERIIRLRFPNLA